MQRMSDQYLNELPRIVLGCYLVLLLAFGIQGYRRRSGNNEEDSRSLSLPRPSALVAGSIPASASIFATVPPIAEHAVAVQFVPPEPGLNTCRVLAAQSVVVTQRCLS